MHAPLSYTKALDLLIRHGRETPWFRHCIAVANVADAVGNLLERRVAIDREHLRVGALLHDIGRCRTHDPIRHGVEGYRLLMELGHVREAYVCASHVLCGLSREEARANGLPDQEFLPRSLEEKLVPMIDSVVELDRPTTLDSRIASIMRRYQGNAWFLDRMAAAHDRVRAFHSELEQDHEISLERIAADTLRPPSADTGSPLP